MAISAIIPALNEEASIGKTVKALRLVSEISQIIVVDDGSRDRTAAEAEQAGADYVLVLAENRGKGGALAAGVELAHGEIFCFVDADLGATAAEFVHLVKPVLQGEADMAVAQFPAGRRSAGFGLVKRLASWGIYALSGYLPASPLSGQRVLQRGVWEKAVSFRDGFGVEVGLTVACVRHGYTVTEVPLSMTHRETGRNWQGFSHRGKQFIDVSRTLFRLWVNRREKPE
ncbi:MAG: glycosyltransferase family 2 protein [Dethiobacter sp.]|jgi:glycosyltransferase involved in cell wall biosynthesis|nr:glycosyltransferase family 2 protein [Dethiobacter sp.]MBS3983388.1 glycosyltransferase family 2 protein [Dethiobacter sp.]MCL4462666.1 glycosyltransferase family 2 protein [Bacillota bacterium]MCL5994118.1 glycosyltransferase family 2 protein [Bacillota bacterium]